MDIPIMHTNDRYELVKGIRSGNFGVARLMRDRHTNELVAIKYIKRGDEVLVTPRFSEDKAFIEGEMSKEKLQMDDWGSPDKRPSFYKFIWRANTIDLPIPRAFEHHLLDEEADMVTLRSPCGNWKIELLREQGYIYFGKGWKEFVEHHSLGKKEFLLFNYNGDMSFDVVIFDAKNLLEKKYPSGGEIPTNQNSCPSSFTSSFPFFKYSIKDYNVGSKSFLQIPRDFSRRHLSNIRQKFVLRNSKGICWAVSVTLIHKNLAISGGWKAFADDNLIKKGDVCVFELVEKTTLQVHVFK